MSILDMFRGAAPTNTPAQAAAAAPAAQSQPVAGVTNDPNANPAAAASPLDAFKDLWQPVATDPNAQPAFNLDSAKIMEAAGKANFASGVSPELIAQALKGDGNALTQAINLASQQSFAQATIASSKMFEQMLAQHDATQQKNLPSAVKRQMVADSLQSNPLYQHEATRPLLAALEAQMSLKHPNATAAEITSQAQRYIAEFANVAGGGAALKEAEAKKQAAIGSEWDSFL